MPSFEIADGSSRSPNYTMWSAGDLETCIPFQDSDLVGVQLRQSIFVFREPTRGDMKSCMQKSDEWLDKLIILLQQPNGTAQLTEELYLDLPFSQSSKLSTMFQTYFEFFSVAAVRDNRKSLFEDETEDVFLFDDALVIQEPTQRIIRDVLRSVKDKGLESELLLPDLLLEKCATNLEEFTQGKTIKSFLDSLTWQDSFPYHALFQQYLEGLEKKRPVS